MLTPRGGWFLTVVVLVLVIGAFLVPYYSVVPALLGVTLLSWFAFEWALFHTRSNGAVSRLSVARHVFQGGREVPMIWTGIAFEVRVTVENPGAVGVPFAVVEDRAAVATEHVSGARAVFAELRPGEPVEIVYTLKCPSPGVLRFEGITVRVADVHGFFYRRVFLRDPVEFLVLPPLADDEGRQRATKRFNTLPPPGIHRLRRPGSGSELHDLRDYRPGDPPKMIAWKPSARRDRLITKEFENDVPVRCVLFLDTSEGVRLGPPGNTLLTRMAGVAAAVSQAAAGNRDLVGLTTFDEFEANATAPARTKIHMIGVLRRLAEVSALQPGVTGVPPEHLTRRAYPLAQELYPELMSKRVNTMPLRRLWIPLLDRKWGWLVALLVAVGPLMYFSYFWAMFHPEVYARDRPLSAYYFGAVRYWSVDRLNFAGKLVPNSWHFLAKIPWFFLMFSLFYWVPTTLGLIFWFFHGIRGWFGDRKKEATRRKQLGALFALQDGTGPHGVERYAHDDEAYAARVAAFLQHHLLRCPVPLYDDEGRYRFRCAGKAPVLAGAVIRAVSRARDNELYVIMADLAELGHDLAPVVKACRVARSRHHHVMVIVPWPADVPSPDDPDAETPAVTVEDEPQERKAWDLPKRKPKGAKKTPGPASDREGSLVRAVRSSLTKQYHESFRTLRRQLGRVGATVMRFNDGDPVRLVLDRLDRVRGLRSRR
jgi:uncharacterized protein (DUF58 family)